MPIHRGRAALAAWFFGSLLMATSACEDPEATLPQTFTLGDFVVDAAAQSLVIQRANGTELLRSALDPTGQSPTLPGFLGWRQAKPDVKSAYGMFVFDEDAPAWSRGTELMLAGHDAASRRLELRLDQATITLEAGASGTGTLKVSLAAPDSTKNRVVQSFACASTDRFFGLGTLVHGTQHRGEVIPLWTSEQGVGKIRRKTPTDGFPVKGDVHDSYFPVPFVLSSRGFGLLVHNSHRSLFHLCSQAAPDRFAVETWSGSLSYTLVDGPSLTTVLERLTAVTGRPKALPAWAMAPWIDVIKGKSAVQSAAATLRKEQIPASAIWSEDWIGGEDKMGGYHLKYQWSEDSTLYPDLKGLIATLHGKGFRFLGYFNPFIEKGYPLWDEAHQKGHVIKDANGQTLSFSGVFSTPTTLPDLSDSKVVAWYQGYAEKALDLGMDGWMADYAEWLPIAAKQSDGKAGDEAHNLYPLLWQKANREVFDRKRPTGDYVFFVRSGWTGTGGLAPVAWAGDQQTEFGGYDGMASVIPICVNAGLSGMPIMTHDIGGYSTVGVAHRTKELFFRWAALAAYSPVMRTHHGAEAAQNWQWDQDAETLAFFGAMARLHVSLFPYRYSLVKEAAAKGLPLMRHLVLHHANDPLAADVKDEFLLGPSLLVAPVMQENATSRTVYLPSGTTWFNLGTHQRVTGGQTVTVTADLKTIPVFGRAGAIIPLFRTAVDTLDRVTDGTVKDLDDAETGELELRVLAGASGSFTQYDGAIFTLTHSATPTQAIDEVLVNGKAWPSCQGSATTACWTRLTSTPNVTMIYLGSISSAQVTAREKGVSCFSLDIKGLPAARSVTIQSLW